MNSESVIGDLNESITFANLFLQCMMEMFQRTELLYGKDFINKARAARVILFGVGGVGSWCAEALIRMGIGSLTIVDSDVVSATNINRQLIATTESVGRVKVEVLKERLLSINPQADIIALQAVYAPETAASFKLQNYDFIIDAIDSLANKAHLIQEATKTDAVFFSSMGAALKTDPTRVKIAEFWKVNGCPLAAALRAKIKKQGGVSKKFLCVYSDEIYANKGEQTALDPSVNPATDSNQISTWDSKKAKLNGTNSYMPAIFGLNLTALVTKTLNQSSTNLPAEQ